MNSIEKKCIICNDTGIINKGTKVEEDCFKCKAEETEWEARERCKVEPFTPQSDWEKNLKDFLEHIPWIDTEDGKKETTKLLIELVRREMKEQETKIRKEIKSQLIKEIEENVVREGWHEMNCPAHSNQMGKEKECNCLYGFLLTLLKT